MKKIIYTVISISLLFASVINAAPNESTSSITIKSMNNWVGNGNSALYVVPNGGITTNPSFCTNTSAYFIPDNASDISKTMLLTAKTNDDPIALVIWGGGCTNNRPVIVNVTLP